MKLLPLPRRDEDGVSRGSGLLLLLMLSLVGPKAFGDLGSVGVGAAGLVTMLPGRLGRFRIVLCDGV